MCLFVFGWNNFIRHYLFAKIFVNLFLQYDLYPEVLYFLKSQHKHSHLLWKIMSNIQSVSIWNEAWKY